MDNISHSGLGWHEVELVHLGEAHRLPISAPSLYPDRVVVTPLNQGLTTGSGCPSKAKRTGAVRSAPQPTLFTFAEPVPSSRSYHLRTEKELSLSPVGKGEVPTLGMEIIELFVVCS